LEANASQREQLRTPRRGRLFWKLLASIAAVGVIGIAIIAWLFSNAFESFQERELDQRLRIAAVAGGRLFDEDWPTAPSDELQSRVRRLGQQAAVRLTLIDLNGQVLADSYQKSVADVATEERHRDRPEFMAAMRSGEGAARRHSPTFGEPYRYHALRVESDGTPLGVVRAGLPTALSEAELAGLNRWIWTIGLLLSAAALAAAWWIATWLTQPLQSLALAANSLMSGDCDRRLPTAVAGGRDEIGLVAAALNEVGKRLAQRESQLHSTSQTQATVLEGMNESVIAVDRSEKVLFANASAGRVLGFNSHRVEDLTLLEAVRSHELRAIMQKALRSRQLCSAEVTWRGKKLRTFDVLAKPLPGDPPPGVVLVLRDISEVKRLEQMRQQFIANVSHELKTPLSSIKAYAETLLAGARNDPEHCERFLERIDEQAGRLHQLIMDMLSLARIESSQSSFELTAVPVAKVISRCLADYEPQAAARQVTLENNALDPNLEVHADEEALRQIISNLVDNAIKYTAAGGRVTVSCRDDENSALIEVADTGIGIAAEHHARLFERFYRVDKARSRELGGTGLGLSIVKHLTQALGGSVAVESEVGRGSRFTVHLPLWRR
jgi:two-component system phosphate regulon sensor histidine kinase PhoR